MPAAQPSHIIEAWPSTIGIYPMIGIAAARREAKAFGPWVLYSLAKALDRSGTGKIQRSELRAFAEHLGLQPRQWQRWINRARTLGLLTDVQDAVGAWQVILVSAARAAAAIGCEHVGARKAYMDAGDLIGSGARARVWAAFEVGFNGRPVSRLRMAEISGVPERTQYHRDITAGTQRRANYSKTNPATSAQPRVAHFASRTTFNTYDGQIAWRLPDARTNDLAQRGPVGRARKANRELSELRQDGSFNPQRPLSHVPQLRAPVRLFYASLSATRAALNRLAERSQGVREIYELNGQGRSLYGEFAWWRHCPT